ncbi:hypothetical protein LEP1GSC125_0958 [Leptospira mayottensis 200901122]|uniref:Uncharacterized protein n=1 Tax=Leptospira mayottensis 200901122 TaxID=1193010 RepID=A0AA87SYE5_9LEPT|nr:hypothetical protein LEP1GSC125_0958 [Leptospira mayottensis 200901122]
MRNRNPIWFYSFTVFSFSIQTSKFNSICETNRMKDFFPGFSVDRILSVRIFCRLNGKCKRYFII